MPKTSKARAVGLNHIALEVGDIEEALAFYGRLTCWRKAVAGRSSDGNGSAQFEIITHTRGDQFAKPRG